MKKFFFILLSTTIAFTAFAQEKYFDRNQLPQLDQGIIDSSDYSYEKITVKSDSIIPVQTQRVRGLKDKEKEKLINDQYRPLIIDRDNYLVDGHHRLDGIKELGIKNVRVLKIDASIEEISDYFSDYRDNTPTFVPINEAKVGNEVASNESSIVNGSVEEIVVTGTIATLINAVDKQRAADNIISVVDSDALGNFPDTTAAEAIRRLSGISVENDQGEGRYVTIRGLSSDLNSVAVNGASLVAPENGRSVLMDGLPTELLDSITVAKSLTPEMDADSIGGRVEFNTKKPSDLKETLFKVKLASKFGEYSSNNAPNLSMNYGAPINDTYSHIFGLTYSSKYITSFNNETGYGWEDGLMNDDFEMRYYEIKRERFGFSYDIDGYIDDETRIFASFLWNQYDDAETRLKDEYGKIKLDQALLNGMSTSRIRHDAESRRRYETRTLGAFNLGVETNYEDWFITLRSSSSFAEEDDTDNADITFRNYMKKGPGGTFNWSNPKRPYFTPDDSSLIEPSEMEFDAFEMWENVSDDKENAFQVDAEKEFDFGVLKMGAKYRGRRKEVDDYIIAYEWDKFMSDFDLITGAEIDWFFANQFFATHATPEATYGMRELIDQMEVDFEDSISRDFVTDEDVTALYLQNTFTTDNAVVIAGARYEKTKMRSTAFDQDGNPTNAKKEYNFFSPSITVKYFLTEEWQLRGAIWRGLSRPGFKETAPKLELEVKGEDISGSYGNPELEPYEADNFDLSLEYYGEGMTFASIGIFRKNIDNAIYPTLQKTKTINGISFNDGVETWINAQDSHVNGLELNFQYGWENGTYIATNLTFTDSESNFQFNDNQVFTTPFRKLADEAANISIGYDKGPWDIRLAGNYRSEYLDWLADEEGDIDTVSVDNSRFVDSHMQFDLTAKYKVNDKLSVKVEAINIGNRPEFYYWGNPSQLSQYDIYGKTYSIGFSYNL